VVSELPVKGDEDLSRSSENGVPYIVAVAPPWGAELGTLFRRDEVRIDLGEKDPYPESDGAHGEEPLES